MATQDELAITVSDRVATIVFNRPDARNALTFGMYEGLAAFCASARYEDGIGAIVLTGAGGKAFAAGTDIAQFRSFASGADALAYEARIDHVLSAVERCPVPTIAAIAGACTGGGAAIAAACDLRIASPSARIGFPIARTLGNCLSIESHARLAALIGPARVRDLILTARLIGAEEALAAGFVGEIVADEVALAPRAAALAAEVAGHAPLTIRATKTALLRLRDGHAGASDDLVLSCYESADFREGLEAFLAKRPARWQGR